MERFCCQGCKCGEALAFDFTMAFHPIVDIATDTVWAATPSYLGSKVWVRVRWLASILKQTAINFAQPCRVEAIELVGSVFPFDGRTQLFIKSMLNAVSQPAACMRATLDAVRRIGFEHRQFMFEFTENERMADVAYVQRIITD